MIFGVTRLKKALFSDYSIFLIIKIGSNHRVNPKWKVLINGL